MYFDYQREALREYDLTESEIFDDFVEKALRRKRRYDYSMSHRQKRRIDLKECPKVDRGLCK